MNADPRKMCPPVYRSIKSIYIRRKTLESWQWVYAAFLNMKTPGFPHEEGSDPNDVSEQIFQTVIGVGKWPSIKIVLAWVKEQSAIRTTYGLNRHLLPPFTEAEVLAIENRVGVTLNAELREYLLLASREAPFFQDTHEFEVSTLKGAESDTSYNCLTLERGTEDGEDTMLAIALKGRFAGKIVETKGHRSTVTYESILEAYCWVATILTF